MFTHFYHLGILCLSLSYFPEKTHSPAAPDWGFYGHRLINRMAVFTLPPEMLKLYKDNIEYISEHAVDPDKRRYATTHEAVRHYMDLDHWGEPPFTRLKRDWKEDILIHTRLICLSDTSISLSLGESIENGSDIEINPRLRDLFYPKIASYGYKEGFYLDCIEYQGDSLPVECDSCNRYEVVEDFTEHGILPYHLRVMQARLTAAFREIDIGRILQLSAEIGHYIGDAHVPLHTTKNYNGQLTGQEGIHAFWESRIPELFAEEEYDFLVGRAGYIMDIEDYYWQIVIQSHSFVKEVLRKEVQVRVEVPEDRHFCFDDRLGITIRTQCADFARSYQESMDGMVEERMRKSILATGSAWYTAWVDAGQPVLVQQKADSLHLKNQLSELDSIDRAYDKSEIKGRPHR